MTTHLITATVFDDVTRLCYSLHHSDRGFEAEMSSCVASREAWCYLLHGLAEAVAYDDVRISVIRRDGNRATSRCAGHALCHACGAPYGAEHACDWNE
jgi:hypothetical protein